MNDPLENLKNQLKIFQEFKELAILKQDALIKNDFKKLDVITAQEECLLVEKGKLEQIMLSNDVGENTEANPEKESLIREIKEIIIELKKIHETNTHLLEQALKTVNYTINLLATDEGKTYKHPQRKTDNINLNLLDRRI